MNFCSKDTRESHYSPKVPLCQVLDFRISRAVNIFNACQQATRHSSASVRQSISCLWHDFGWKTRAFNVCVIVWQIQVKNVDIKNVCDASRTDSRLPQAFEVVVER